MATIENWTPPLFSRDAREYGETRIVVNSSIRLDRLTQQVCIGGWKDGKSDKSGDRRTFRSIENVVGRTSGG